jgi:hypothetical protein
VWSSKSIRIRDEKDTTNNCCSQCQSPAGTQIDRASLGAKSETGDGPFTSMTAISFATPARRASGFGQQDPGAIAPDVQLREDEICEDRGIKDLERQYLGKYKIWRTTLLGVKRIYHQDRRSVRFNFFLFLCISFTFSVQQLAQAFMIPPLWDGDSVFSCIYTSVQKSWTI